MQKYRKLTICRQKMLVFGFYKLKMNTLNSWSDQCSSYNLIACSLLFIALHCFYFFLEIAYFLCYFHIYVFIQIFFGRLSEETRLWWLRLRTSVTPCPWRPRNLLDLALRSSPRDLRCYSSHCPVVTLTWLTFKPEHGRAHTLVGGRTTSNDVVHPDTP